MDLKFSVDDEVIRKARIHAEALGTSVDALIRNYIEDLASKADPGDAVAEFERLWSVPHGDSGGWKFNRDEIHERR